MNRPPARTAAEMRLLLLPAAVCIGIIGSSLQVGDRHPAILGPRFRITPARRAPVGATPTATIAPPGDHGRPADELLARTPLGGHRREGRRSPDRGRAAAAKGTASAPATAPRTCRPGECPGPLGRSPAVATANPFLPSKLIRFPSGSRTVLVAVVTHGSNLSARPRM